MSSLLEDKKEIDKKIDAWKNSLTFPFFLRDRTMDWGKNDGSGKERWLWGKNDGPGESNDGERTLPVRTMALPLMTLEG